ncbi:hypothetical protein SLEP1_g49421 [Rubroshorea leprosula]|uniref:Retrotransposon gag domain-containing protein n=1 Tax=Rubroshorea leprosula TaxID=152421 RepID=A0AAV5LXK0_9ROSI|nr:hypothetical protein SLEP1_g49421 [Rubroshorea leprosula]
MPPRRNAKSVASQGIGLQRGRPPQARQVGLDGGISTGIQSEPVNLNVGGGGDRNESHNSSTGNHDQQRINDDGGQMAQQDQPTVRDLMQAFVDAMSGSKCGLTDFVKLTKPFDGSSTDLVVAEDWIDDIEKAFKGKGVLEEQKVPFAAYMLKGDANNWWKIEERILTAPITWEKSKESFYRDFIPSSVRVEMQRKYFNLQQGNC